MSQKNSVYRSPLFYVGDKYKLLKEIKQYFPKNIDTFVEPFVGGGSVFLNVNAKRYLLSDIDKNVISIHKYLLSQNQNEEAFFQSLKRIAKKYNLSRSYFEDVVPSSLKKQWEKTYYAHFNREGYQQLREDYNKSSKKDPLLLYVLLIYGFNRMLRFNQKGEFNIPVGNVDLNQNVIRSLKDYFNLTKDREIDFCSQDFKDFLKDLRLSKKDFVYVDPPYLITGSEYNKLWSEERDVELMHILDELNRKNIKFAMSNVTSYQNKQNKKLIAWAKDYKTKKIDSNYINYHDNRKKDIKEVLITNY